MKSSLAILLVWQLGSATSEPFRLAEPGYRYAFPRDNFNHPEFQTEWWYYTGNLRSSTGRRFGFELTFFRQGVDRSATVPGVWDVRDLWLAHLALSDLDDGRFLYTERLNRSGAGIAGADGQQARVWNGNWQAQWKLDPQAPGGMASQRLQAVADRFSFDLTMTTSKPPVIHGENSISQKAEGLGRASHYISFTRLKTNGVMVLDGQRWNVEGESWMDHEFFTHQLAANQSGWDWFSLQLSDGSKSCCSSCAERTERSIHFPLAPISIHKADPRTCPRKTFRSRRGRSGPAPTPAAIIPSNGAFEFLLWILMLDSPLACHSRNSRAKHAPHPLTGRVPSK